MTPSSPARKPPRLIIRPSAAILAVLLLLLDGSILALMPLLAALCHEAGHLFVMRILGVPVRQIEITPFGAEIRTLPHTLTAPCASAVYAAGAAANLLCAAILLLPGCPPELTFFAACSLSLAMLNLLPIRRLDGGCILEALLGCAAPMHAERILGIVSAAALGLLWLAAGYILLLCGGNVSLLLFCICMFAELYL